MSDYQFYSVDENEIDTVLAEDFNFNGTLNFDKSLMIKGHLTGDVNATGDLYIDEGAVVEARVKANIVSLKGTVKGDILADTRVELFASASVDGDITAPDIVMESGCRFKRNLYHEVPIGSRNGE